MGYVIWDPASALFPSRDHARDSAVWDRGHRCDYSSCKQRNYLSGWNCERFEVLCGKVKYPPDFLVLGSLQDSFFPIIFGRHFLRTCGAIVDRKEGQVSVEFNGEPYEFNFSKFSKQPRGADLPSNDKIIEEIASIDIRPNDPL